MGEGSLVSLQSPPECPAGAVTSRPGTDAGDFLPFQRIPIPVHSMGPDGLLMEVNAAWVEYTGYAKSRVIGRSFADFLDPASASRYLERAVPELIGNVPAGESRSIEYRLIKASGETADIVLTARAERDPATGRFLHSLSVLNDITARNRAEMALRQAQKLEALGNLTSGVAHDFNNLLMIILGSLELLTRRLPADDARSARLVDAAMQGASRGAALTSRLLAFARQQELTPVAVKPAALFSSVRELLNHMLGRSIRVEEDLAPDLWNLRADPNQLELALLNLAANARDAMRDGGCLRLAARNATIVSVTSTFIGARPQTRAAPGDYVVLTVSDTGSGMDENALARAADPFFTTKGPGKGTGLGLSMVYGFTEQSGGAMVLASKPGVGTTVELWLPKTLEPVPGPATDAAAMPPVPSPSERSLRILLVDDDPLIVAGTIGMLEELGHVVVHSAASGEEALTVLSAGEPLDLLVTDHVMPGMSGATLAIKARAQRPGLPVLIASGFAELDALTEISGARLRKPYSLGDLATALAPFASAGA